MWRIVAMVTSGLSLAVFGRFNNSSLCLFFAGFLAALALMRGNVDEEITNTLGNVPKHKAQHLNDVLNGGEL